jgi:hypothetical protein
MPLARGTAAVGYTTMLGLFWAAGMPISSVIPKDYQVGPAGFVIAQRLIQHSANALWLGW